MDVIYTIFHFILALGILVAIHEFGHFWVARKSGVKVIRFSIGFGKVIWSYQKTADSTEYVLSAIPLGGYVKMVDEREGDVKADDLPYAFNRQSLFARSAIVAAGPIFNLLLAFVLFWAVFVLGETGMRPLVGAVESGTLASNAGFIEGEEILSVDGKDTPTWSEAMGMVFSSAMQGEKEVVVLVKNEAEVEHLRYLNFSEQDTKSPDTLIKVLGLRPWTPKLPAIIGKIIADSPASFSGLKKGDLIISADKVLINDWMQWVGFVKERPEVSIALIVSRDGVHLPLTIMPERIVNEKKDYGRIGAGVSISQELIDSLRVEYSLGAGDAVVAALDKTWFYSSSVLKMMGNMLVGKASVENLSGPISIAQYAGQSAEMGLVPFLKFLALVSISLGVLNLLPIPVLDGGHLMFFIIEAVKGSPVPEKIQIIFQQAGIIVLMSLMLFAVILDIGRLFN